MPRDRMSNGSEAEIPPKTDHFPQGGLIYYSPLERGSSALAEQGCVMLVNPNAITHPVASRHPSGGGD